MLRRLLDRTLGPYFFFDRGDLSRLAARRQREYAEAAPFPHAVFDEFLPRRVARRLLREFPLREGFALQETAGGQRLGKRASSAEEDLGSFTRHVLYHLNSGIFLDFLAQLTGIQGLLPDPEIGTALRHFDPGGRLGVHADFNFHGHLRLDRRLNLILYLNRRWRPEWQGHLELWDPEMTACVRRIEPVFNRAIVFTTTDRTPHGFPQPLACPAGETRKSLQLYYYTVGRPDHERAAPHGTLFLPSPAAGER
jgi:Rps23 Pro-64 3,4-dihydroxylase Tpa1-like proline 4-hydroxylase